ncbi:uncharacterized protein LY89DRAFT_737595 [Mollisia scopiformis]|uniref:Uncharacterized protein n=1 Tax=Mollisia scopiformis TaxID=149040 RepID=A0A194X0A4_MOLSC|nr:uncharacterized protein LY89DRAFT_737595 [Mollisia scopiformis]KUJ13626.1 hypothetical protein LY89DRAFT_737595 [Mollisia scopiformis]
MSDDELDREWKPSARPQSTMARSFSLALNDLFKIDNSVADLDAAVYEKKKAVSTQTSELEALEARLKATEERLKKASAGSPPGKSSTGRSSPRSRVPLGDTFKEEEQATSPLASEFRISRPNTGRPQTKEEWKPDTYSAPMPGALPPTPGASEGESESEYVLVSRRQSADTAEDGDNPPHQK